MGLTDALLFEAQPFEVWVGWRDGIKGSGTLNDPWDASTKYASSIGLSQITNTGGDPLEATATTQTAHSYSDGDVVTIDGVTGAGSARWNGTFVIYAATGTTFKYYMLGQPADAAVATGATVSKVIAFRFDEIMSAIPGGTHVHLVRSQGRTFKFHN